MRRFRWGIFGTGVVAAKFAAGLAASHDAKVAFVASRSLVRAKRFADVLGIPRAVEGYAEAAQSRDVDAIYIATTTSEHAGHALMCIEQGRPVLVEKPLAINAEEARGIFNAARKGNVFAMEAMWTRFTPAALSLRARVAAGEIGRVRMLTGGFGVSKAHEPTASSFDPARGGGAMLQLGVYPLSLGQWLLGTPAITQALGTMSPTGVDEDVALQLQYPNGAVGSFHVTIRAWGANEFHVSGECGLISFDGPLVRPSGLTVLRRAPIPQSGSVSVNRSVRLRESGFAHRIAQATRMASRGQGRRWSLPYEGNGYHYQADEVRTCLSRGMIESAVMPLSDSIAVLETIDDVRAAINLSKREGMV